MKSKLDFKKFKERLLKSEKTGIEFKDVSLSDISEAKYMALIHPKLAPDHLIIVAYWSQDNMRQLQIFDEYGNNEGIPIEELEEDIKIAIDEMEEASLTIVKELITELKEITNKNPKDLLDMLQRKTAKA